MVSFLIAPEATRSQVDELYDWMNTHHRACDDSTGGRGRGLLLVVGISKL